jgi:hypothetical protein
MLIQKKSVLTYSSSLSLPTHWLHILTWNSWPRTGIDDLFLLQSSHMAAPHLLQWCCLLPTVFNSHIAFTFQKNGFLQYSHTSLSRHCGFLICKLLLDNQYDIWKHITLRNWFIFTLPLFSLLPCPKLQFFRLQTRKWVVCITKRSEWSTLDPCVLPSHKLCLFGHLYPSKLLSYRNLMKIKIFSLDPKPNLW